MLALIWLRSKRKTSRFYVVVLGLSSKIINCCQRKLFYENIAYAMEVIGENRRNIKKRVMEVLDLVGLKHKVRFFPK